VSDANRAVVSDANFAVASDTATSHSLRLFHYHCGSWQLPLSECLHQRLAASKSFEVGDISTVSTSEIVFQSVNVFHLVHFHAARFC